MTTASQPSLAAEIATLRDQLREFEAGIRMADDEIRLRGRDVVQDLSR